MRYIATGFLALGLLVGAGCGSSAPENQVEKNKPRFTISKETTFVTGPVDKDGFIDYAAALNQRLSKGVTPDNNANVLLWKAMGPHPEGAQVPAEFFKWLGIPAPPNRGDYFIGLFQYTQKNPKIDPSNPAKQQEIDHQLDRALELPWTAKELPSLAAWLKANEKPLALVVEASRRPRYFYPLIPNKRKDGSPGLIGALIPGVYECRHIADALLARAMLRVGEGKADAAWQDLLACHRLGRLIGQGGTGIEALVSVAIDLHADQADLAFLDRARPNAKFIQTCLHDLEKLPDLPDMAEHINFNERFLLLEIIMMVNRRGLPYLERVANNGRPPKQTNPAVAALYRKVDWDPVLRKINRWYDRIVAALRQKDRAAGQKEWKRIEHDFQELKTPSKDIGVLIKPALEGKPAPEAMGDMFGNIMISNMMPAAGKLQDARDRAHQSQENLLLAFALAWYKADQGHYPKTLEELAPKYVAKVPPDIFSGKPLIYRPTKDGYLLYSVGVNGKDDQGRGYDDEPPGDDLSVRMPLPKLPRK